MAYLLDSDVFIRAKNDHYGFDFCPAFWTWLEQANADGSVYSVQAVYDELAPHDDPLAEWVKDHQVLFMPFTADVIPAVAAVNRWANESPDYDPAAKSKFASAADSFLIGHAIAGGHTVVTHERNQRRTPQYQDPQCRFALALTRGILKASRIACLSHTGINQLQLLTITSTRSAAMAVS